MNESPARAAPKRIRCPYVLALAIVLLVVLFAAYRYSLDRRVQSRIEAIHRQGHPVSVSELAGWQGRGQVDAKIIALAGQGFTTAEPWTWDRVKPLPIVGRAATPSCAQPLSTELAALASDYLAADAERMAALRELVEMEPTWYPADWFIPPFHFPSLNGFRQAHRVLQLEAISHIERHDPARAVRAVLDGLQLVKPLRKEPLVMPRLLGLACEAMALSDLRYILCRSPLTDQQLQMLSSAIVELETELISSEVWIGERCFVLDEYRKSLRSDSWERMGAAVSCSPSPAEPGAIERKLAQYLGPQRATQIRVWQFRFYRMCGIREWDLLHCLNQLEAGLSKSQLGFRERAQAATEWEARVKRAPPLFALARSVLSWPGGALVRDARRAALVRATHAALAVEQFRNVNGQLPESLEDLAPACFSRVPLDPFNEQPLRYQKLSTGYVVYSTGEDGVDDGGDPKKDISFIVER